MSGKTMKIFAATSSSSDSIAMLYKLLTETKDDVITRILTLDASDQDLAQYPIVCNWLKENVRDFDFQKTCFFLSGLRLSLKIFVDIRIHCDFLLFRACGGQKVDLSGSRLKRENFC